MTSNVDAKKHPMPHSSLAYQHNAC